MEIIGILIAIGVGFWVHSDAVKRQSSAPVAWGVGVACLLIVFLPLYLICRPSMPTVINNVYTYHTATTPKFCGACGKYSPPGSVHCTSCGVKAA